MTNSLTFAELQAMERTHVCRECEGPLVVAWIPSAWMITGEGRYELQCGQNKKHKGLRRFRKEKAQAHIKHLSLPKERKEKND